MKLVRCRDHGFDCDFEVKGTEDEVLQKAAEHANAEHGLEVTPELAELFKAKMHEVKEED